MLLKWPISWSPNFFEKKIGSAQAKLRGNISKILIFDAKHRSMFSASLRDRTRPTSWSLYQREMTKLTWNRILYDSSLEPVEHDERNVVF